MTETIHATEGDSAPGKATFITALPVTSMFVDHSYQRDCDLKRARHMAEVWDPQLVGVLDVADRGEHHAPRYSVINGQHRWMAAKLLNKKLHLAVNVHTGLSVAEEAKLFDEIDRNTKALTTWDRWYARRAAGDPTVREIERIVADCGLEITQNPGDKHVQCCTTLERIWTRADAEVLAKTLTLILDVWSGLPDSMNAAVIEGVSWLIDYHDLDLNTGRLGDAMCELTPRQLRARGSTLREQGDKGSLPILVAHVLTGLYNKTPGPGPRLPRIELSSKRGAE
ncbi:hypothetical protein JGU71_28375 [Antrihabitans sp. YC3-6]|uniref:ParB/Sulfiredoxin domain-containing protein n=1 Tax=Antrihabitans stalagmiti TaxID=2799499 RepID=A0A934U7A4_9NOCA|nr:DUF6551 family protein [Antrihabitans stalagmiti]MBJ8342813.1 hypothetical protein [Antrihabitans stalagmiti]